MVRLQEKPACWGHTFKYKAERCLRGQQMAHSFPTASPPSPRTSKVSMVGRDGQVKALHPLS